MSTGNRSVARHFGENLRRARHAADLTHEQLSERTRLHRTEIGLLERGERIPRIDTALKVATAVGVGVEELLAGIAWTSDGAFAVDARKTGESRR